MLRSGDATDDVRNLQEALAALGFPLGVDGRFGARTDDAVRGFQLALDLPADGIFGRRTAAALADGRWADVAAEPAGNHVRRIHRTDHLLVDEVVGEVVGTEAGGVAFTVDVTVPVFTSNRYPLDVAYRELAATVDAAVARATLAGGSVHGDVAATLLAPSVVACAGMLHHVVPGCAAAGVDELEVDVPIVVNLDLAAGRRLLLGELFLAGTDWVGALQRTAAAAGLAPEVRIDTPGVLTPDGVRVLVGPELAPGDELTAVLATWADLADVVRPSIVARCAGHGAGGPGAHPAGLAVVPPPVPDRIDPLTARRAGPSSPGRPARRAGGPVGSRACRATVGHRASGTVRHRFRPGRGPVGG
ncbi:MAG: peptidoglycan-binding domain-containing protein [Actinomycetota bacterium]|nr:peptidoglycan-binding domain-containing protein [Actinomycetota bacterium]